MGVLPQAYQQILAAMCDISGLRLGHAWALLISAAHVPPCRRKLLALNPNNHRYHEGLQAALGLAPDQAGARTPQQRERLSQVYIELAQQYPKAGAVRRLPLDFKARSAPSCLVTLSRSVTAGCR